MGHSIVLSRYFIVLVQIRFVYDNNKKCIHIIYQNKRSKNNNILYTYSFGGVALGTTGLEELSTGSSVTLRRGHYNEIFTSGGVLVKERGKRKEKKVLSK